MNPDVTQCRACSVCGAPSSSVTGICQRTPECRRARFRAANDMRAGECTCSVCGGPLSLGAKSVTGICKQNAECKAALYARQAASRRSSSAALVTALAAGHEVAGREQELAVRAGQPCPVCGRALGANGGCWQSQRCIDDAMYRVSPRYNPAGLYVTQVNE